MKYSTKIISLSLLALLTACADNDSDDTMQVMAKYEVKVYNLTANQPLTNVAVLTHKTTFMPWQMGVTATVGLEKLAESGDNTDFINTSKMNSAVTASATGAGIIAPGSMETITISANEMSDLQISVASMLANTNDAFTGVANWTVGNLAINESTMTMTHVFDAGTEPNTEAAGTIPGPADGGTGFDAMRESINKVVIHPGVVSKDDGLAMSVLNESHRWLGAAAKVVVTRIE